MKEKITQLSKEIFEYELPQIILSEEKLEFEVESGKEYSGRFIIKNNSDTEMKGLLYSSAYFMKLEHNSFVGKENEIVYFFSAKEFEEKQDYEGYITIVSNCGERKLPFIAHVIAPYVDTQIGKIDNLFHFANLAKVDWTEAIHLFKSSDFERIFLYRDTKNKVLYRSLIKGISTSQALEEFLIGINKKPRVNFNVEEQTKKYEITTESIADKIILNKNHWGHIEIRVSTDCDFIIPDHKIIWGDNFIGNSFVLDIVLNPFAMCQGLNKGKIILTTIAQTIEINVEVNCKKERKIDTSEERKKKELSVQLVENYLQFRSHHILTEEYVEKTEKVLEALERIEYTKNLELFKIHCFLIQEEEEKAKQLLLSFEEDKEKLEKEQVDVFCGYMYLKALISKQENDVVDAVKLISKHYKQESRKWNILWYLLFLDKRFESNKTAKLKAIKEQFENGCHSPVLYYEVCAVYNEVPALLKELDFMTIQAINMGLKLKCLSWQVAAQYAYLAGKEKKFNQLIFNNLVKLYDQYRTKDVLAGICSMLIKGEKIGEKYFGWYQLGVEEQLRITELHEYYMYSIEEDYKEVFPSEIYSYFTYSNMLPEKKKALLFVNIIKHKKEQPHIYDAYKKQIIEFAKRQLALHKIDFNLAFLYKEFFLPEEITEEEEIHLPFIMFMHKLKCTNRKLKGAYVVHKECREEQYISIEDGEALFPVFTENAELFFVDSNGNRYIKNIQEYTLEKLMPFEEYAVKCYEVGKKNEMLLLYLLEQVERYQNRDEKLVSIKYMVDDKKLRNGYQRKYKMNLLRYYYDNYDEEKLEALIRKMDLSEMRRSDRIEIIEISILCGLYDRVLEYIFEFGYKDIEIKKLMRFCSKVLQGNQLEIISEEKQLELIREMCYHIFHEQKYDEYILKYLVNEYIGTTKEMFEIWQKAKEKKMNTVELEERLLGQMLFAESYVSDSAGVFISYYRKGSNHVLKRAFLCYSAYKYLLYERVTKPEIFEIMKKELLHEKNEAYTLALLKYYSGITQLSEEQKKLVDYYLNQFIEDGKVFAFFKGFKNKMYLPGEITDQYFVEYITNPGHTVKIHYLIEDEEKNQEYITETMENVYHGIFVKTFTLFYNEILQYYITETDGVEENITESIMVKVDVDFDAEEDRYNQLNLMLMAQEMQDEKTLLELMDHYIKTDYGAKEVFKML